MPKKLLSAEVAGELATLASNSQLESLVIDKYKSGKNKGQYFADYVQGERTIDVNTINVLVAINYTVQLGHDVGIIEFQMPKDAPPFVRWEKDGE